MLNAAVGIGFTQMVLIMVSLPEHDAELAEITRIEYDPAESNLIIKTLMLILNPLNCLNYLTGILLNMPMFGWLVKFREKFLHPPLLVAHGRE